MGANRGMCQSHNARPRDARSLDLNPTEYLWDPPDQRVRRTRRLLQQSGRTFHSVWCNV